jgi:hypothetical protein
MPKSKSIPKYAIGLCVCGRHLMLNARSPAAFTAASCGPHGYCSSCNPGDPKDIKHKGPSTPAEWKAFTAWIEMHERGDAPVVERWYVFENFLADMGNPPLTEKERKYYSRMADHMRPN